MKIVFRNKYYKYAVVILPYVLLLLLVMAWFIKSNHIKNASFIIIDKNTMQLSLFNYNGELLQQSKVATGKNFGNKKTKGDLRTPEGIFHISEVLNASDWKHDFKDDTLGEIAGAYGPYFIRLNVPGQKGIGIHGTHDTSSLGKRASEGCIRMRNEELEKLVKKIKTASIVIILPAQHDLDSAKTSSVILADKQNKNIKIDKKNTAATKPKLNEKSLEKNTKTKINTLKPKKPENLKPKK